MVLFNIAQTNLKNIPIKSKVILPATLADCARTMSFNHCYRLKKIYSDIIGRLGVDHVSINAVPRDGNMLIFSKAPSFGYALYSSTNGIILDTAISPTFYTTLNHYFWDDCYPRHLYKQILKMKEEKNGFKKGVVFVRVIEKSFFLYSFATKSDPESFVHNVNNLGNLFFQMGDYCLERVLPIYEQYADYTVDNVLGFLKRRGHTCSKFSPRLFLV